MRYRVCDAIVESELPLRAPAAAPSSDEPAIEICRGAVPERLDDVRATLECEGVLCETAPGRCLVRLGDGARLLTDGAHRIVVDADDDGKAAEAYLLGTCLAAALYQQGRLVLHGSAIATARGAVLFLGDSGKGKSTTAASFLRRGCGLLSDDLCAIRFDAEVPAVLPAVPEIKLCQDALDRFGHKEIPTREYDKGLLEVRPHFVDAPRPLLAIFHLRTFDVEAVTVEHLSQVPARRVLDQNLYRRSLVEGLAVGGFLARAIDRLVTCVPVYRAVRPRDADTLEQLTTLVADAIDTSAGQTLPNAAPGDPRGGRFRRSPAAVDGRVRDRTVVRELDAETYFVLDAVGARVWELLASPRTSQELCEHLLREYDVSRSDCERDVGALLADLRAHRLIRAAS
jgi:hypothetical protein